MGGVTEKSRAFRSAASAVFFMGERDGKTEV